MYSPVMWVCGIGWGLIINYATYLVFKFDKARAIGGLWRVPEETLLVCALLGGSIGAKVAQRQFRHKTRKQPFRFYLDMICALHLTAATGFVIWRTGHWPALVRFAA